MTAGVYAIRNTATGQIYVGSSANIEVRWSSHRATFSGPDYEWTVLEVTDATDDALEQTEQRWMDHYAGRLVNRRRIAKRPRPSSLYLDLDGLRLQARREALGLTVMSMAYAIGVTPVTLLKWEKGVAAIRSKNRRRAEQTLTRLERRRPTPGTGGEG